MRYKIEKLNDISDSREIMQSSPNGVSKYMFYIISSIMIFLIIWSVFAQKDIVVNAVGEVGSEGKVYDIYNETAGIVVDANVRDGQLVKKGDILLKIDNETVIKAQCDGIISLTQEVNQGDFIKDGIEIAKIIPSNESEKKVTLYINNQDIGKVKNGQDVNLEITSFPKTKYGTIKTTLENISDDIKINKGNSYYTAICNLDITKLKDKEGNSLEIKNGMLVNASILNRQVTYFKYFLEEINVLN